MSVRLALGIAILIMGFLLAGSVVLFLLFVVIRALLRLTYGLRGPAAGDFIYTLLSATSWTCCVLALGIGFVVTTGPLSILLGVFTVVTIVTAFGRYHSMQRRALLTLLTVATEKNLPLGPALTSFDDGYAGNVGAGARRMATLLDRGLPLIDAMKRCSHALPRYTFAFARAGATVGALAPALREANQLRTAGQQLWEAASGRLIYLFLMLMAGLTIVPFVMISIVPSFAEIFSDFNLSLPPMTVLIVNISNAFVAWGWIFLLPLIPLMLMVFVLGGLRQLYQLEWIDRIPGVGLLSRGTHGAVVLRLLAVAAERNQPLDGMLRSLAESYSPRRISRRLTAVADDAAQGHHWCESMRRKRLISTTEQVLLQSAERVGNLSWALRMVADRRARRFSYRMQVLFQILSPIVVLILGAGVMFFVVGMFIPLVELIVNLS